MHPLGDYIDFIVYIMQIYICKQNHPLYMYIYTVQIRSRHVNSVQDPLVEGTMYMCGCVIMLESCATSAMVHYVKGMQYVGYMCCGMKLARC